MAGTATIPQNIGSGGSHFNSNSHSGGLKAILQSLIDDLTDIKDAYNAHTHQGGVATAPSAASPAEAASVGTAFA